MSEYSDLANKVAQLTQRLNNIVSSARKIFELPFQSILKPGSKIQVSNPDNISEFITVQQILDAALSYRQNQLVSIGTITVAGNNLTIPAGATWVINNIDYSNDADIIINVPYAEDGFTRTDIIVADQLNNMYRVNGPETEGVSPAPNVPLNTVLVTTVNVTDDSVGYVPPVIDPKDVKWGYVTATNGGSRIIAPDEDALLVDGGLVANYTVTLPTLTDAKKVLITFNASVTDLNINAGGVIDDVPTTAKSYDTWVFIYDPLNNQWSVVSAYLGNLGAQITTLPNKGTITDIDYFAISDGSASSAPKKVTANNVANYIKTKGVALDANVIHTTGNETKSGILNMVDMIQMGNVKTTFGLAVSVSKTITITNRHIFEDYSVINSAIPSAQGFGVFDASTEMTGTANYDHLNAYQSRLKYTASGNMLGTIGMTGLYVQNEHSGSGDLVYNYGIYLHDINGSGPVGYNYGLKIDNIYRGTALNWAIHSDGGDSRFKGDIHNENGKGYFSYAVGEKGATNKKLSAFVSDVNGTSIYSIGTGTETPADFVFWTSTGGAAVEKFRVNASTGAIKSPSLAGATSALLETDTDGNISRSATALPTSGTYTPTISSLVNITSVSNVSGTYTKIGNIVSVTIRFLANETAGVLQTSFVFTLPINRTGTTVSYNFGTGNVSGSGGLNKLVTVNFNANNSTGTAIYATNSSFGGSYGSISFQYDVTQ